MGRSLAFGLGRGLVIFGCSAVIALALGMGAWALAFGGGAFSEGLVLSWIALASFNRIGIGFVVSGAGLFGGSGGSTLVFHVAALSVTAAIGALGVMFAYRARRDLVRTGSIAIVVAGIAVGYALPVWIVSAFVRPAGSLDVRTVSWEAFVLPFGLMLISAAAGAWLTEVHGSAAAALSAGGAAFAAAVTFAFVGFLITAALSPSKSAAYLRYVTAGGANGMVAGAHVLMLPNQSVAILAPAMGSCDVIRDATGSLVSVCGTSIDVDSPVAGILGFHRGDDRISPGYWLFLLVPLVSTVGAGRTLKGSPTTRLSHATLGGVVYAGLVGIASAIASVSVGGSFLTSRAITAGPEVIVTTLVALAWGVVGIGIGSLLPIRRHEPPSPTSV